MRFTIERLELTDANGVVIWPDGPPPRHHGHADGNDAGEALVSTVASAGDVRLDIARFSDGQALLIAKSGLRLYALRAVPFGTDRAAEAPLPPLPDGA